ncbi:hypothetical protein Tco_0532246 [Tanacetum coccineum]
MYDDMTYLMLVEMVVKKFKLDPNDRLNLSVKLYSLDSRLDIKDDDNVKLFVECACSTIDGIQHLYVGQPKETEARIIPGPASILQAVLIRKNAAVMEGGPEYVMPTQEHVRKIIKDAYEDSSSFTGCSTL